MIALLLLKIIRNSLVIDVHDGCHWRFPRVRWLLKAACNSTIVKSHTTFFWFSPWVLVFSFLPNRFVRKFQTLQNLTGFASPTTIIMQHEEPRLFCTSFFAPCLYLRPEFWHGGNQRGKGEGQQGGGFPGEPAEGPSLVDLQRGWGFHAKSFSGY